VKGHFGAQSQLEQIQLSSSSISVSTSLCWG
jgi:hypothetical protein